MRYGKGSMSKTRKIYLITLVEPGSYNEPFGALNFKQARDLVIEKGSISKPSIQYKTGTRRMAKFGFVIIYDRAVCSSDLEAKITGYWSIEKITLYK